MTKHPAGEASHYGLALRAPRRDGDTPPIDSPLARLPLRCPCCLCKTLRERGCLEICAVCFWQDDGQDEFNADVVRGGPNGTLSLSQGRANYRATGACDAPSRGHVRQPRPEELPDDGST